MDDLSRWVKEAIVPVYEDLAKFEEAREATASLFIDIASHGLLHPLSFLRCGLKFSHRILA